LVEEEVFGATSGGFVEHVDDVEEEECTKWVFAIWDGLLDVTVVKLGLGGVDEEFDAALCGYTHLALG
jgi:hypothetical protein